MNITFDHVRQSEEIRTYIIHLGAFPKSVFVFYQSF